MYVSKNFWFAKMYIYMYIDQAHVNKFQQCIYASAGSESVKENKEGELWGERDALLVYCIDICLP